PLHLVLVRVDRNRTDVRPNHSRAGPMAKFIGTKALTRFFALDFRSRGCADHRLQKDDTMATKASFSPNADFAAIARVQSRAPTIKAEIFNTIAVFCGAGLAVLLLLATNGLDMSVGFF